MSFLFDAHCHLDFDAFDEDRSEVLARAERVGVRELVVAAVDPDSSARARTLGRAASGGVLVRACAGLHPWWVDRLDDDGLDAALTRLRDELTGEEVAIGECGLDAVSVARGGDAARQERALTAQLDLALERGLPAVLHAVRCHDRLLALLRARSALPQVLLHGWSGPSHLVPHFVALGGWFSFGPRITRGGHSKLERGLVRLVEAHPDRWMLETDSPDVGLSRGARGEPGDLEVVAAAVATTLGREESWVRAEARRNAAAFYRFGGGEA